MRRRINVFHNEVHHSAWWLGPRRPRAVTVALHGFTGDGLDFTALAESLPDDVAVLAPDLIGHGDTEAPADVARYHIERCAEDVVAVTEAALAEQGCDHLRPTLLGYSMGGRVALTVAAGAALRGGRWRSLILIGATAGLADPVEAAARRRADAVLADEILRLGVVAFAARWRQASVIATQARIPEHYRLPMEARRRRGVALGWANSLRGMGTGAMPPLWDRLGEIALPTLLITGAEDLKFDALAEGLAQGLPQAKHLRIPGAGHAAHLEAPAAFRAALG